MFSLKTKMSLPLCPAFFVLWYSISLQNALNDLTYKLICWQPPRWPLLNVLRMRRLQSSGVTLADFGNNVTQGGDTVDYLTFRKTDFNFTCDIALYTSSSLSVSLSFSEAKGIAISHCAFFIKGETSMLSNNISHCTECYMSFYLFTSKYTYNGCTNGIIKCRYMYIQSTHIFSYGINSYICVR